jgi:hypothetical protein
MIIFDRMYDNVGLADTAINFNRTFNALPAHPRRVAYEVTTNMPFHASSCQPI